ncbi:hypothetical protein JCM16163A_39870 [Paenibacillus sp. YK5]|uniref:Small acid-soluble spore protein n=1 Tax=Paenibacillus naphthalenovorans TaxID=162209 RepID=A0A0U2L4A3_9BACL|nr:small acid-soluble spore protein [Paenibacillus naphthalenovorans]GCL74566.1 hypothetical protein PN4B1_45210 [Paenibacillus naphthalenovorans]SDJ65943.1 Small, acid-soluble spore protein, alpha/beta type [Paenibacillus naphthalenovorans]
MGRRNRRGVMSDAFKYELAKDLGFYETVQREGWGGIRTKDAGNMVKRAIQIAEGTLQKQNPIPVGNVGMAPGQGTIPAQGAIASPFQESLAPRYGGVQPTVQTPVYSPYSRP